MMSEITATGMVLSAMSVGEADKRLVLLTKEYGKIHGFARGAKRTNSPLLAASQPFTFGTFTLREGTNAYTVTGAEISNYFVELRSDLDVLYYGYYFMELAEHFGRENIEATETLKLLYQSLKALSKGTIPKELIRYIFEWKILTLEGMAPQVFSCMKCGTNQNLRAFSAKEGGAFCENCVETIEDALEIDQSTMYTLCYIIASPIEKLYTFRVSKEVLSELSMCRNRYFIRYVDGNFKSLEFLQ